MLTTTTALTIHQINEEPRVLDTDIAEMLGFFRAADIRKLIQRHLIRLEQQGVIATVAKTGPKGGRPARCYYLNQAQALYIVTESQTERASDIKSALVKRFVEYERGTVVPRVLGDAPSGERLPSDLLPPNARPL